MFQCRIVDSKYKKLKDLRYYVGEFIDRSVKIADKKELVFEAKDGKIEFEFTEDDKAVPRLSAEEALARFFPNPITST